MARVFISYRRADSATFSGRVYDRLVAHYGRKSVFKDVDDIPAGVDFADYIQTSLRQCVVALVVIGPRWLEVQSGRNQRRLDNPADFVRVEIETALAMGLTVIPLLVDGAHMPGDTDLPDSLRRLTRLNALTVRNDPDFSHDMERVIAAVDQAFAAARPSGRGWFGRRANGAPLEPTPVPRGAASSPDATRGPSSNSSASPPSASVAPNTAATPAPASVQASAPAHTAAAPLSAPLTARPRFGASLSPRLLLAGLAGILVIASFGVLFYSNSLGNRSNAGLSPAARAQTASAQARAHAGMTVLAQATGTASEIAAFDATALPYKAPAPGPACDAQFAKWQVVVPPDSLAPTPTATTRCSPDHTHLSTDGSGTAVITYELGYPLSLPQKFTVSVQTNNLDSENTQAALSLSTLSNFPGHLNCYLSYEYVNAFSFCGSQNFPVFSVSDPTSPHTLAMSFDGTHVTLMVDGNTIGSLPQSAQPNDVWRVDMSIVGGSGDLSNFTIKAG